MKKTIVTIPILLAGCAVHTWSPGPGVSAADFERTRARCSIMARSGQTGFSAYGSTGFVAGAALGNAIGNAVRANRDFNDCMLANGFQVADRTHTP